MAQYGTRGVLFLDTGREWGGGQSQTYLLQKQFKKNSVFVLTATPENSVLYKKLHQEGAGVIALPVFLTAYNPLTYYRIITGIKKNNIEILYAQTSRAHTIGLLVKFFLRKIKLYVARRVLMFPGKNFFSQYKYKNSLVDGYIAVSKCSSEVLKTAGIPAQKIFVVYNGIDFDVLISLKKSNFRSEFNIPDDAFVIGTVGSLIKIKDQKTFLKAISHVLRDAGSKKIYFIIVGEGKEKMSLKNFAEKLGIDKKVIFTGYRQDIFGIVNDFFLFILTSTTESFCNAVLESLASGVPVISTNVGGVAEQVDNNKNGFLIDIGNSAQLAEKIIYLLNNPGKRQEMSACAGKLAERFSIDKTAKRLLEIFNAGGPVTPPPPCGSLDTPSVCKEVVG